MKLRYGLGIDAGGTHTDVAIVDFASGKVLASAKAPTTQPDPCGGIREALHKIPPPLLSGVVMVALATTFASNAIVENTGAKAGLILVGYDEEPPDIALAGRSLMIGGGHRASGLEKSPLDLQALESRMAAFLEGLEAVAVAGFFSVRNPAHELEAARLIEQKCDLPVVLGHRVSTRLDANRRAITALWNARLMRPISRLIDAIGKALCDLGISVPVMIVKGDGSLISAATARQRPIDTLLSGCAASTVGARHLTGLEDALVVDIGGTTTDMALLSNGSVVIDPRGARLGRWETHVEAPKMRAFGLGGDSLIAVGDDGRVVIGPRRAIPLAVLGEREPGLIEALRAVLRRAKLPSSPSVNPCLFTVGADGLTPDSVQVEPGPFAVLQAGLTPTDVRIATDQMRLGEPEAARLGVAIFARLLGLNEPAFAEAVEAEICRRLSAEAVSFVAGTDGEVPAGADVECGARLRGPVVGAGAPAGAYVPGAFGRLHAQCILPECYPVTGAVGAVVGSVSVALTGLIRPTDSHRYALHTPTGMEVLDSLDSAVSKGKEILEGLAEEQMCANHVTAPVMHFSTEEKRVRGRYGGEVHLETALTLRATGRPTLCELPSANREPPRHG